MMGLGWARLRGRRSESGVEQPCVRKNPVHCVINRLEQPCVRKNTVHCVISSLRERLRLLASSAPLALRLLLPASSSQSSSTALTPPIRPGRNCSRFRRRPRAQSVLFGQADARAVGERPSTNDWQRLVTCRTPRPPLQCCKPLCGGHPSLVTTVAVVRPMSVRLPPHCGSFSLFAVA